MSYEIPAHPASTVFPLMDGIDLRALVDDVSAHGLLEPIVLLDGQVLDGRNRLRACELAGVEPRFVEWDADGGVSPQEWVVSHNLHRRHLTTGQRAALALDLLPRLEDEARERQKGGQGGVLLPPQSEEAKGEAAEKAAALVGVGRTAVATAKAIQRRDETGEVIDSMRAGDRNIAQAAREVGLEARGHSDSAALDNGNRTAAGHVAPVYFGKGDKWAEASQPLRRYLAAWEKRGYRFGHVNWKEASKRVQLIDELIDGLTEARQDLETRSHKARPFTAR